MLPRIHRHKKVSKEEQSHCNTREDRDGESIWQSSGIELSCKRVCRSQLQCAISQKDKVKNAYGKGVRTREPLTLNISEFGSATLIKAARIWNDSCMLLHIDGRDTIAMEIKYHRSCYKNYVHPKQLAKLEEQNCQEEDAGTEGYDRAFGKVKEFVEKEVIAAAKAIPMSTLIEKYTSFLTEEGVDVVTYRSTRLKNWLTRFFGERLSFHRPSNQNQSELVYGSHFKTGEVVETVFKSTTSVDEEQIANSDSEPDLTNAQDEVSRQVYHTAKTIQKLVANMKPTMPWPPSSEDLECEIEMVPDLLYNMMAWILSTKSEDSVERVSDISPEVHLFVRI